VRHRAAQSAYGRTAAGVVAWVLGTGCAVAVGALALSLIGSGLGERSRPPLAAQVIPASSASSAATAPPSARSSPRPSGSAAQGSASPSASPIQRDFAFDVGWVTAACDGDMAYLVSWSPAQGYRVDEVRRGPAAYVRVEFESFTVEAAVWVRCVDGIPRASISHEPHH
jgi:hypothetical protein